MFLCVVRGILQLQATLQFEQKNPENTAAVKLHKNGHEYAFHGRKCINRIVFFGRINNLCTCFDFEKSPMSSGVSEVQKEK